MLSLNTPNKLAGVRLPKFALTLATGHVAGSHLLTLADVTVLAIVVAETTPPTPPTSNPGYIEKSQGFPKEDYH